MDDYERAKKHIQNIADALTKLLKDEKMHSDERMRAYSYIYDCIGTTLGGMTMKEMIIKHGIKEEDVP